MAITRIGHGTVDTPASGNIAAGLPASILTGDQLLYLVSNHDNVSPAAAAEWRPMYNIDHSVAGTVHIAGFETLYDSGAPPDLTLIRPGGSVALGWIVAYRSDVGILSVDRVDGLDRTQQTPNTVFTINYPDAIPDGPNEMVVYHWSLGGTGGTNGPITGADPAPTERLDQSTAGAHAGGYADGLNASGTALGARQSTDSANGNSLGAVILIRETYVTLSGTALAGVTETEIKNAGDRVLTATLAGGRWRK